MVFRYSDVQILFHDDRGVKPEIKKDIEGPEILKCEVQEAIRKMKKNKACGPDGITAEMIQALDDFGVDKLTTVLNEIYNSGDIPEDLTKSIFITLPKKPGAIECELHRTISLMSHVTKIIMRILMQRARNKIQPEFGKEQFGFIKDSGTRNATFTLRRISERAIEIEKDLYLCFLDYAKAFDKVRHDDLLDMLQDVNLDGKDLRLLRNLYWNQSAGVRIDNDVQKIQQY